MSGLREVNMSTIWLLGWPTKSTKTCPSSLTIDVIHCASISSMPSCLRLYLASADGDAQLFSVCLFVCRSPHSGHLSESVFFHLKSFAAVDSCCWKAFLTNVKNVVVVVAILIAADRRPESTTSPSSIAPCSSRSSHSLPSSSPSILPRRPSMHRLLGLPRALFPSTYPWHMNAGNLSALIMCPK